MQPGQSYTFPVKITVPCPMNNGTYQLRFKTAHTVQTKDGPVEIPFGDPLTYSVNVGTTTVASSGVKIGVKTFTPSGTYSGVPERFTRGNPGTGFSGQTTATVLMYHVRSSTDTATTTVFRNFNPITGLLWTILLPEE